MADIEPDLDKVGHGRNFAQGQDALFAVQCLMCHRMGDEGGAVGPDLTAVSSRFARKDILESILEPSKVVSEQYRNVIVTTNTGKTVVGRLLEENAGRLVIQPNPLEPGRVEVNKSDVDTIG